MEGRGYLEEVKLIGIDDESDMDLFYNVYLALRGEHGNPLQHYCLEDLMDRSLGYSPWDCRVRHD